MKQSPNVETSTSFWRKVWSWLSEAQEKEQPILATEKQEHKPEIRLSLDQQVELSEAMDQSCPNDTNFLPSDTSFRARSGGSGGSKSVII